MFFRSISAVFVLFLFSFGLLCGSTASASTDQERLAAIEIQARADLAAMRGPAYEALRSKVVGPMAILLADPDLELIGVLRSGHPLFYGTNNLDAAVSVSTDAVWPGGWTGLDLTGANTLGSVAIWDGGQVRTTHQEFQGRVTVGDGGGGLSAHATHVAGTIMAAGLEAQAIGMSYAAYLLSHDWNSDSAEMAAAAADGLLLSNHSYGFVSGWRRVYHSDEEEWYWYWWGETSVSEVEDWKFGFYNATAALWDDVAHAAPYYLIVKSAGNDRNDVGPGPGGGHYFWDQDLGEWSWSTTTRDPDGGHDGFDSIPLNGIAKNILTVGAVEDVPGGWTEPGDVTMSTFSGWGPSDDGRIKPDLVANGVGLYSSVASGDDQYATYSGTSMSAPNVTGSLNLLTQQHLDLSGGQPLLASSLKAIVLHTASETGPAPGPDYMFGWGLLNTAAAGLLIADAALDSTRLFEKTLTSGAADTLRFYHDGNGPLKVTLVWADPAGTPPPLALNPTTPMLVNDLDLRLIRESDSEVFYPWVLDPSDPTAPATTGPNHRDNVEIIEATGAGAGLYLVTVGHTGSLTGDQVYSLVQTGLRAADPTAVHDVAAAPRSLRAYPNPFNPSTEIAFSLNGAQTVQVAVFDARGRRVAALAAGHLASGEHRLTWDGRDEAGRSMPTGVYLIRLVAGGTSENLRISLVK